MIELPEPGLYRTTLAYPGHEDAIPRDSLVYVGDPPNGGLRFVVRPGANRRNQWYWGEPTVPLRASSWGPSLRKLPPEGFYTLPDTITFPDGSTWLKNAIVQLGYNENGRGILFVGQREKDGTTNALFFATGGYLIEDSLLDRLTWAPILPVDKAP